MGSISVNFAHFIKDFKNFLHSNFPALVKKFDNFEAPHSCMTPTSNNVPWPVQWYEFFCIYRAVKLDIASGKIEGGQALSVMLGKIRENKELGYWLKTCGNEWWKKWGLANCSQPE